MASFPNRCQYIKVNGTQCGCPALRRNKLCYFHKRHHEERVQLNADRMRNARARRATIDLPVLEDANSIQVSLMQIMRLLVSGSIDPKIAGLMLYALQTASHNLGRTNFAPLMNHIVLDPRDVSQTPLGESIWDESDFEEEEEDEEDEGALQEAALEAAAEKLKKQQERERWAEAEMRRLMAEGVREREERRRKEAAEDAQREANREAAERRADAAMKDDSAFAKLNAPKIKPPQVNLTAPSSNPSTSSSKLGAPSFAHFAKGGLPQTIQSEPPNQPTPSKSETTDKTKRPAKRVPTVEEAREQVRALVRKAAPAMLAAVQARKDANKSG